MSLTGRSSVYLKTSVNVPKLCGTFELLFSYIRNVFCLVYKFYQDSRLFLNCHVFSFFKFVNIVTCIDRNYLMLDNFISMTKPFNKDL